MAAGAKITIKVLSIVIGIPVGIAARKLVERTWAATGPTGRPRKPSEDGVQLADAIAWGALSAVGIVVADMITRRGAEAAYEALTGNEAPPAKQAKSAKQLEQASKKSKATAD